MGRTDPAEFRVPGPFPNALRIAAPSGGRTDCPSAALKFLIFAGKGGVGKTTLACATALRLAREFPGKEILLFSTDPAHSLAACLEGQIGPRPVRLAPGLSALEIDAPGEFAALKRKYQQEWEKFLGGAFERIDFPFDRQAMEWVLELSPPGLDEIMALVQAMDLLHQGRYDLFILDSAPTGHLLRLLELPELLDQWLKTFFGLILKYKLAIRFPELSQLLVKISRNLKLLRKLWRDPAQTALYAVTILTEMAFQETGDLLAACGRLGMSVPVLFCNQATPASDCPLCTALHHREALIREKCRRTFGGRQQAVIYRQREPKGLQPLKELGQVLYRSGIMENRQEEITDLPAG